jgi:hypothetical protein
VAKSAVLNIAVLLNAAQASAGLDQVAHKTESVGSSIAKTAGKFVAGLGVAAFVKDTIASLANIERINAQTEAAIKSTGGAAGVSATHVEDLANNLEKLTATEAESVQEGANLLLTFTNIKNGIGDGNDVFDQATATLVDMSRALGTDAATSAVQLGKALNDPIKGITALSKVGVSFTEDQKALIKSLVESGDVMGAQKIILAELNKEFGGSGAAYAATAAGQWDTFTNALGDFGEKIVSTVMPALTSLMSLGTSGLGWLTDMPVELQAAGIALGIFIAFGPKLVAMMVAVKASFVGFREEMVLQQRLAAMGGQSLGNFGAAAATAQARFGGFAKALGSATILTAVVAAITTIISKFHDLDDGLDHAKPAMDAVADAWERAGRKMTADVKQVQADAIVKSDPFKALVEGGADAGLAARALSGDLASFDQIQQQVADGSIHLEGAMIDDVIAFADGQNGIEAYAASQAAGRDAVTGTTGAVQDNTDGLADNADAAKDAEEAQKKLEDALKSIQDVAKTALDTDISSQLIGQLDRAEQAADRSGKSIHAALEAAFPERAQLRSNGIAQLITDVQDAGKAIKDEDIGGKVKDIFLDIQNQDPIKLAFLGEPGKVVSDWAAGFQSDWDSALNEIFQQSGGNVDETVRVMLRHTQSITQGVADQLGIPFDKAEQVIKTTIGNIDAETLKDKVLSITADDQELFEKTLFYQSITFDPTTKTFVSDIKIPAVDQIVAQMNAQFGLVTPPVVPLNPEAPAGSVPKAAANIQSQIDNDPVTIDMLGNTDPASDTVGDFTSQKLSTPESFISVRGNINPFQETITKLMSQQRDITVNILGNVNPWQATITGVMSQHRDVTVDILGNTAPVRSAIAAVENGSYSATVRIIADTSGFFSTFNTLPSSRVVNVAPAATQVQSFAAPTLMTAMSASSTDDVGAPLIARSGGSGGINITVNGAIDPDSTARQIRSILERRGRRSGGIAI